MESFLSNADTSEGTHCNGPRPLGGDIQNNDQISAHRGRAKGQNYQVNANEHTGLNTQQGKIVCRGDLKAGGQWGCGRNFATVKAFGRHLQSKVGRLCIQALFMEEDMDRQLRYYQSTTASEETVTHPVSSAPRHVADSNRSFVTSILPHTPPALDFNQPNLEVDREWGLMSVFACHNCDNSDNGSCESCPGPTYAAWWIEYVLSMSQGVK
ncbi:DNA-binding transcription factor [Conoideocrella luteorostrata]|uniref:DNA-binding transcription factor n=1 Tax=Conoideocrella luteorostrata TaxID=1105319 RepID=A0AAJ0CWH8_9HYPO|nr:DNA-binding transcription factor [Conoideocrella luteorostrata]